LSLDSPVEVVVDEVHAELGVARKLELNEEETGVERLLPGPELARARSS